MALLLTIETTTKNCSVALFNNNKLIQVKEKFSEKYIHAEQLTSFIYLLMDEHNIKLNQLDCVVLSKGPGSYTGLRVGTSTAKGICYALDIPLVVVSTLKSMAYGILESEDYNFYCPMIDARRMEVFAAIYDSENNQIREVRSDIVDEKTYSDFLESKVLFFGDGSAKCRSIIKHKNAFFIDDFLPSAKHLGRIGFSKYLANNFEDVAYFEPYYLKDFLPGLKKKN